MQSRAQSSYILKIPINNDFDREILRRKILKLQSLPQSLFVKIKKIIENGKQYFIEYDTLKMISLRSSPRQKQLSLSKSNLNQLPNILKTNSINTRISIMNIYISSSGQFLYLLNLKQFDICAKQESTLLQKIYMMEWETIISMVNNKKQQQKRILEIEPKSPRFLQHVRQGSMSKLIFDSKTVVNASINTIVNSPTAGHVNNLSESKRFFTSSNKPQPKSKQDFNNLKTIQFKNILNMNQEYMHQFIDVLCDDNPTNYTDTSTKLCSKSTRSF